MFLVVVLYALFALTFAVAKRAIFCSSPLILAWSRSTISALCLLSLYAFKNGKFRKFNLQNTGYLLSYTISVFITILGANYALVQVSSAKAALIYSLSPLITAVSSYFLWHTKLAAKQFSGLGLGLLGVTVMLISTPGVIGLSWQVPNIADYILLIAVITYSIGWFLVHPLITTAKYSPIYINGISSALNAILYGTLLLIQGTSIPLNPEFWWWTAVQAIIISVICYTLYMHLLNFYSANFLAFAYFMEPLFAAIYGWLLLAEVPSTNFWIASGLVTLGLLLFYLGEQKQKQVLTPIK